MADDNKKPFYANSNRGAGGGNRVKELRIPMEYATKPPTGPMGFKSIKFCQTNEFTAEAYQYLRDRIPHNMDQGNAVKELIAAKLLEHALDGRALTVEHTKYILPQAIGDVEQNCVGFAIKMGVWNADGWAKDRINGQAAPTEYVDTTNSRNSIDKNGAKFKVMDNVHYWQITPMNNYSDKASIYPAREARDAAVNNVVQKLFALEREQGKKFGKSAGQQNESYYVAVPVVNEPTPKDINNLNSPMAVAADDYQAINQQEAQKRAEERVANAESKRLIEEAQVKVFDTVYQYIANTVVYDAMTASHENALKYGSAAVDENGKHHPYVEKKSENHDGTKLLSNSGIRIPAAGNHYYRLGYDAGLDEVKSFIKTQFPEVNADQFANEHLSNGSYFKTLATINSHLSENAPTHLIIPFQDINGDILGGQVIADDKYARKNGNKTLMKSVKVTENELFMNLGAPVSENTKVVIGAEGAATAESLAIALLGPDYAKNPEIAVIAFVTADNLKRGLPTFIDSFKETYGQDKELQSVVAIDSDNDKSTINPNAKLSYERTRTPSERGATNSRGATLARVARNAGLDVFQSLREQSVDAHFITVPSMYNQRESEFNIKNKDHAAFLDVTDFNDMISTYGVSKSRELLQPQIKAMQLGINYDEPVIKINPTPTAFENSIKDFAIGDALRNYPKHQEEFVKAVTEMAPAQKTFQEQTHSLANHLHGLFKDKDFRMFVNDYVSEAQKSNPPHYETLNHLRQALGVVHLSPTMNDTAGNDIKNNFMSTLLSIHLNDPKIGNKLDAFADSVNSVAMKLQERNDINPASNVYMAQMVDAAIKLRSMGDSGSKMMDQVYNSYAVKVRPAIIKIGSYYLTHSSDATDHDLSQRLKLDERDHYKRTVDPDVIAMQIPKEPKEPEQKPKPDDNSPSPDM